MSKLYVANTSKHVQEVQYWVAGATRAFSQTIGIGQQALIYDTPTATLNDHAHIVEQLARYGVVSADEIGHRIGNKKRYTGLCYRFEKPVNIEAIQAGLAHNDEVIDAVSLEQRKISAATLHHNVNETSRGGAPEVELEFIEQQQPGSNADTKSESLSVVSEGRTSRRPRGGKRAN